MQNLPTKKFSLSKEQLFYLSSYLPNQSQFSGLEVIPSPQEILKALFEMDPYKAPGSVGFHPVFFFLKCWDLLGSQITSFVHDIFNTGTIPDWLNCINTCLFPKKVGPTKVDQFRPISLCNCNTIYKIISKILINRIRPILASVISPNQVGFVVG